MKKVIFAFIFLSVFSALTTSASAQKNCRYDSKGPEDVPAASSELVTSKGGKFSLLAGKVVDTNGAALADARASLSRVTKEGNVFYGSLQVDNEGNYCFGTPPKGKYILTIGSAGFNKQVINLEVISAGSDGRNKLNIKLNPGR